LGGGLVWGSHDAEEQRPDAGAAIVRAAVKPRGGHATLVVAPEPTRRRVPVFEPEDGPLGELIGRIKAQFDPMGVLNPGRMREGR
jgi:glycolate oxidase FAD binding subunit